MACPASPALAESGGIHPDVPTSGACVQVADRSLPLWVPLRAGTPHCCSHSLFRMALAGGVLHGHVPLRRARDSPYPRSDLARGRRWDLVLHHA